MTSHFQIYDDQENNATACGPAKVVGQKQIKSVLSEISQNAKNPFKRVTTKSDDCEAFTSKEHPVHPHKATAKRKRQDNFGSQNKENSFSAHPIIKKSSSSFETLDPVAPLLALDTVAPLLALSDSEDDESSCSGVTVTHEINDSSVFQDISVNQDILSKHTSRDDILSVAEYSSEIHSYLKGREVSVMAAWNYMERQRHITHDMRAILVNWLVEVALEYKLSTQTVYLAINYVDRFLSLMMVDRSKLQLVGTAAMFLAAKYEEIYPPPVEEFAYITDNTYTKKQVLRMENLILKVLGFNVSVPTSLEFLHHYTQMFKLDRTTLNLSQYLNELSLLDGKTFLKFSPSVLAASSVVLARHTLGVEAWPDAVASRVGYTLDQLEECVAGLYETFVASPNLAQQATRVKFKDSRFGQVADIIPVNIM